MGIEPKFKPGDLVRILSDEWTLVPSGTMAVVVEHLGMFMPGGEETMYNIRPFISPEETWPFFENELELVDGEDR